MLVLVFFMYSTMRLWYSASTYLLVYSSDNFTFAWIEVPVKENQIEKIEARSAKHREDCAGHADWLTLMT